MEKDAFKKWQPNIYSTIKKSDSDEEDEILSDIFPDIPPLPVNFAPTTSGNTYVSNQGLKVLILPLTNFVTSSGTTNNDSTRENASITLTELPALKEKINDSFKCRKNFRIKCTCCDEDIDLPRNAMMIPGLSAALTIENERRNPSNEADT